MHYRAPHSGASLWIKSHMMRIPLKLLSFLKYKTQEFFSNSTGFFVKFPPLDVPQNLKCDKISIQICNFGETRFI